MALLERGILVRGGEALQGIPFGTLYELAGPDVLVPVGTQFRPALSPQLLSERLGATQGTVVLFPGVGEQPLRVARESLVPLEPQLLARVMPPASARRPARARSRRWPTRWRSKIGRSGRCRCGASNGRRVAAMRRFVSDFLLPIVRGGPASVGRPLGPTTVARIVAHLEQRAALSGAEADALAELAACRLAIASRFLPAAAAPRLDETSVRLGAALHDLLALGHPELAGPGVLRRQTRIAAVAKQLAALGPPRTAEDAVARHSLLSRLPDIVRVDRTVHFWLGRQSFVGRTPPRRVTALPALRRVRIESTSRSWLREIGIPAVGAARVPGAQRRQPAGRGARSVAPRSAGDLGAHVSGAAVSAPGARRRRQRGRHRRSIGRATRWRTRCTASSRFTIRRTSFRRRPR